MSGEGGLDQGGGSEPELDGQGWRGGGPRALHSDSFFLPHSPPPPWGFRSLDFPWCCWRSPQDAGDLVFPPAPAQTQPFLSYLVSLLLWSPWDSAPAQWAVHKTLGDLAGERLFPQMPSSDQVCPQGGGPESLGWQE